MAIDAMEEIIIYEEKAKKIKENAEIFAKQIYEEIISAARSDTVEKEYKDKLAKNYRELKEKHNMLLQEYEKEAKEQADTLLNNLCKHKDYLTKSLVEYILDKE